ncbi:MAG: hypothetical protein ACREMF_08860, partial [Gemmatimonadales bacterium]
MSALFRDRRGSIGLLLLAAVVATALAAPLFSGGEPNAPGDVVATRFLAPLTRDGQGGFHLLGTD